MSSALRKKKKPTNLVGFSTNTFDEIVKVWSHEIFFFCNMWQQTRWLYLKLSKDHPHPATSHFFDTVAYIILKLFCVCTESLWESDNTWLSSEASKLCWQWGIESVRGLPRSIPKSKAYTQYTDLKCSLKTGGCFVLTFPNVRMR